MPGDFEAPAPGQPEPREPQVQRGAARALDDELPAADAAGQILPGGAARGVDGDLGGQGEAVGFAGAFAGRVVLGDGRLVDGRQHQAVGRRGGENPRQEGQQEQVKANHEDLTE